MKEKFIKKKFHLPSSWTFNEFWNFIKAEAFDQLTKRQKAIAISKRKYDQVMDFVDTTIEITPLVVETVSQWTKTKKRELLKKLSIIHDMDFNAIIAKEDLGVEEFKEKVREEKQQVNIEDKLTNHPQEDKLRELFENPLSIRTTGRRNDKMVCKEKIKLLKELEEEYPKIRNSAEYQVHKKALKKFMSLENYGQAHAQIVECGEFFLENIPKERKKCRKKALSIIKENYFSSEEEEANLEEERKVKEGIYVENEALGEHLDPPIKSVVDVESMREQEDRSIVESKSVVYEKDLKERDKTFRELVKPIKEAFEDFTEEDKEKLLEILMEKRNRGE